MKRKFALLLCLCLTFSAMLVSCADSNAPGGDTEMKDPIESAGKIFYVAPDGNDGADGSETAPFATLEGAKNAVKALKSGDGLPDGGVVVCFKSGTYPVRSTIEFTSEDSGEEGKPIIYTKEKGAEVIFDGGISLEPSAFVPASDEIKARVQDPNVAAALLEIDLASAGCYDLDGSIEYNTGSRTAFFRQELFVDNERQQMARWPNSEFAIAESCDYDDTSARFSLPEEKAKLWRNTEVVEFYGCPVYDWSTAMATYQSVSVDPENSYLVINQALKPVDNARFYVFNVLEEIDEPGEYCWDFAKNKIYYYPNGSLDGRRISFSQYNGVWFIMNDVSYLTFDGLTFENGRAAAFERKSNDIYCDHITVKNCVFRCFGTDAVRISGNQLVFDSNTMSALGGSGVRMAGGDAVTNEYSGNVYSNNLVHDFSQIFTVYNPAIEASGYGFTISHNEFYNSSHEAIAFNCGDSVIEYNYIHDVCSQTSDAGAMYSGRTWTWRGNVIRYNYIRDVVDKCWGGAPNGIYMDDMLAGQEVYGNLLVNIAGTGICMSGGKDEYVHNNVLVKVGGYPINVDERGIDWAGKSFYYPEGLWAGLKNTDMYSKLHIYRFPQNLIFVEKGNQSTRTYVDDPGTPSYMRATENIGFDCVCEQFIKLAEAPTKYESYVRRDNLIGLCDSAKRYGTFTNNCGYLEDPGFVDAENGNYALREDSRVFRDILGFVPIPLDEIGRLDKKGA